MGLMRYNFKPLTKVAELSLLERAARVFAEEYVFILKASATCELNGTPGTLKLGGGPWYRIVFVPDDPFYLGRCFLDFSTQQEAEREFEKLAERLRPAAKDDAHPQPAEAEPEVMEPPAAEDAPAEEMRRPKRPRSRPPTRTRPMSEKDTTRPWSRRSRLWMPSLSGTTGQARSGAGR